MHRLATSHERVKRNQHCWLIVVDRWLLFCSKLWPCIINQRNLDNCQERYNQATRMDFEGFLPIGICVGRRKTKQNNITHSEKRLIAEWVTHTMDGWLWNMSRQKVEIDIPGCIRPRRKKIINLIGFDARIGDTVGTWLLYKHAETAIDNT